MTTLSIDALPQPLRMRPATAADSPALRRLWQLFRYDMSHVNRALPDQAGCFRSERLERALSAELGWEAWIATAGPHPVAFAVARGLNQPEHVLTSFFVLSTVRRAGLGQRLALTVLRAHPGRWAIAFQDSNPGAAQFWPRVGAALDPAWTSSRQPVPGRPDLPMDRWLRLNVTTPRG